MKRATAKAVGSGRVVRVDSGKKDGLRESKWKSSESTLGTAKDGSQLMAETNYNAYPATESRHVSRALSRHRVSRTNRTIRTDSTTDSSTAPLKSPAPSTLKTRIVGKVSKALRFLRHPFTRPSPPTPSSSSSPSSSPSPTPSSFGHFRTRTTLTPTPTTSSTPSSTSIPSPSSSPIPTLTSTLSCMTLAISEKRKSLLPLLPPTDSYPTLLSSPSLAQQLSPSSSTTVSSANVPALLPVIASLSSPPLLQNLSIEESLRNINTTFGDIPRQRQRQLRRISKRLSDFNYVSTTSAKTSNSFVNTLNGNTVWLAAFDDPNLLYVNNLQRTKENQTTYNVVQTLHLKETAVSMELEVESSDVLVPSSPSDDVDTESPIERAASTMGDIDTLYDIDDVAVDGNDDSNNDNTGDLGLALEFNTRNPPLVSSSFDDGNVVHVGRWLRFFDEIDDTNDTDAGDYEEDSNASSSSNIEDDYYNDKNFDIEVYHRRRDDAENQCCWVEKQEWSGIDSSVCLEDGIDSDMNDNDCDSPEQKFGHFTESEIINRIDQLSRMKLQVDSRPLSQTVMIVNTMILLDPFFND